MAIEEGPVQGRAKAARELFEAAATTDVELVMLSGMELCVLGGERHLLADEAVTKLWLAADVKKRTMMMELSTRSLLQRGLLIADEVPGPGQGSAAAHKYPVKPELGMVLTARTRPTVAVLCHVEGTGGRSMKMYVVGDQEQPARGVVVELPAQYPPGKFPSAKKLGALGALYRYVLVSPEKAADMLAQWAITPPPGKPGTPDGARTVSVFCHHKEQPLRIQTTTIIGDGQTARLAGHQCDDPGAVMGITRLRNLMAIHLRRAQQ
jgi:hypothetical protein